MTNINVSSSNGGAADLFFMLESNKLSDVEETKQVLHDHFLSTKDSWLVNGLFDYYLSTNSSRAVEILAGVREPHDKHLFDKLTETLIAKPVNYGQKVRTLTLLSQVARKQPTWLYKLASHSLFKQLLHLLKVEENIVLLMSALLLLITLLPMLPTAMTPHLQEIFEVFSRIASFYYRFLSIKTVSSPTFSSATSSVNLIGNNEADQLYILHLQVGLHNLFQRLYAMYPCNFVNFLKQQYLQRDQIAIFKKVIGPMLDSVRMHPLLVTMSKETEISSTRWKKMEHHDVVAECSRFSLLEKSSREDILSVANMRFTPISESQSCPYTPVSTSEFPLILETGSMANGGHESFWSPSMSVAANSPPPPASLQATPLSHLDVKSAPTTPGVASLASNSSGISGQVGTVRNRTSPPEAAVEATPESTPVKDSRQLPLRQLPTTSPAVRALGALGNGTSRPSTPSPLNHHHQIYQHHHHHQQYASVLTSTSDSGSILDRKLGKLFAERQQAKHDEDAATVIRRTATPPTGDLVHAALNGRVDSQAHLEDQEVSDIVSAKRTNIFGPAEQRDKERRNNDLSRKVRLKSYRHYPTSPITYSEQIQRTESCPELNEIALATQQHRGSIGINTFRPVKSAITTGATATTEEMATQTSGLLPYESLMLEASRAESVVPHQGNEQRLSPSVMLERYIELCAKTNCDFIRNKFRGPSRRYRHDDDAEHNNGPSTSHTSLNDDDDTDRAYYQQMQLMQMQLQFERQRREVHAERNRRLLGKLRDSRALEEKNSSMTARLKLAENEIEKLKSELNISKTEARTSENKHIEAIQYWKNKCKEEQQKNTQLRDNIESLQEELKIEKKRAQDNEKQTKAAEATLFEAAHQLKKALRTANQSDELKRVLDTMQKRFLLLGEAQIMIQEKMNGPVHMSRQESALMQRSWSEEVSNFRRQLDQQSLQLESLKSRCTELEHREARKEVQLTDQQRLLQESKEKHSAELEAVESKYKAQLEINLLLQGRILELHGKLEQSTFSTSATNLASSVSPKERSPPLSTSLASSSEGSLAFIHSVVNECDTAGEIANLEAIVEPKEPYQR